jgi:hypothetical protein
MGRKQGVLGRLDGEKQPAPYKGKHVAAEQDEDKGKTTGR